MFLLQSSQHACNVTHPTDTVQRAFCHLPNQQGLTRYDLPVAILGMYNTVVVFPI